MNYIIKYEKNYMAITNKIESDNHKHWLFQFFLSAEGKIDMMVNEEKVTAGAVIVNVDCSHRIYTESKTHFTALIDPTSTLGQSVKELMKNDSFFIVPDEIVKDMQEKFTYTLETKNKSEVSNFVREFICKFDKNKKNVFDSRISDVFELFDECTSKDEEHQIDYLSKKVNLSKSRLAHLFKLETGIPLKSYILLHKLQNAYELVFEGKSITEAVVSSGFYSPSHFAYTNKKMTGMSATAILKDSEFLKVLK